MEDAKTKEVIVEGLSAIPSRGVQVLFIAPLVDVSAVISASVVGLVVILPRA